jgi:hypothetical protein
MITRTWLHLPDFSAFADCNDDFGTLLGEIRSTL